MGSVVAIPRSRLREERFGRMLAKLKQHDFRITPQRLAILKLRSQSEEHPSLEQIYERVRAEFPTTSLATVYKTIALLKEIKEVLELGFPDASNRYDGFKPFPHVHVICTKCRKIMDPELIGLDELIEEMGNKTGYSILSHRLDFFGVCEGCQGLTAVSPRWAFVDSLGHRGVFQPHPGLEIDPGPEEALVVFMRAVEKSNYEGCPAEVS